MQDGGPNDPERIVSKLFSLPPEQLAKIRALLGEPAPASPDGYQFASLRRHCEDLAIAADYVADRWESLVRASPQQRTMLFTNASQRTQLLFLSRIVEEAYALRFSDRCRGHEYLLVASSLLPELSSDARHAELAADIKAKVHMYSANSFRLLSDIPTAEERFEAATRALSGGTRDPLLRATLNEFRAWLDIDLGRIEEASHRLEYTVRTYQRLAPEKLPSSLISRALVRLELENYTGALEDLRYARAKTPPEDAQTLLIAAHNQAAVLERAGRPWAALRHLHQTEPLYTEEGVPDHFRLARDRMYGRVYLAIGRVPEAARLLAKVRDQYHARQMHFEAVWAGLELASARLALGDPATAATLVAELYAFAQASGLQREALAALLAVRECAAAALTPAVLAHACSFFRRLDRRPSAIFAPLSTP